MFYVVVEPTPEGWVCYNVESREEVERSISLGGWEMSQEEIQSKFGDLVYKVSPITTEVSADGKIVTFHPPSQEELDNELATFIRLERDSLLLKTDYLLINDYPISQEKLEKIKIYRQALRDITKQEGFPNNVVWPVKPEL